jgi:3',5'-cyclic-AMP phosphodiesterase
VEVTTVADDLIVAFEQHNVIRLTDLQPDTEYELVSPAGASARVRTLRRPAGALLCRFGTVNDVHFGEVECGRIDDNPLGPIKRVAPGEDPYPLTMNRAAVAEIAAADLVALFVKGDLSVDGHDHEWAAFEECYGSLQHPRYIVRGNHDSYRSQTRYSGDQWIQLPGVAVALMDTALPGQTTGSFGPEQLEWLDSQAAAATTPVLVMGHHQQWIVGAQPDHRPSDYFGLDPDSSEALDRVAERNTAIVAYTAGHTHRHRVRRMTRSGIPSIEIGCVKDFPGTWAEYRVFEGGIMQVVHRISAPEALSWSERCRDLYSDFGMNYETYALGTLEERCCNIPLR